MYKNAINGKINFKEVIYLSFQMIQKLKYIFDGYSLMFILLTNSYGLWVDINQSKKKGTNRDAKMAKRVYITLIALIISLFIIVKFL